ncbi:hypothetical protein IFM89_027768 [Coptis chinensis]|uniref:Cystatin domain-containing protein n=1 Tax=Coptis chinensis TaxID=261450 RepID=A0A835I8H8_9MAGN|nr:hypothetical protein IFM89_027768 [Coptis chinensis]
MRTQSFLVLVVFFYVTSTFVFHANSAIAPAPNDHKKASPARLGGGGGLGGYKPIEDVKDPHIQDVGKFAVSEYNKQAKTNLRFSNVIKGQMQTVAGINYRLVIAAKKGGATNNYLGEVYERPWEGFMNLTSFRALLRG